MEGRASHGGREHPFVRELGDDQKSLQFQPNIYILLATSYKNFSATKNLSNL
jgi:hypothetical protein